MADVTIDSSVGGSYPEPWTGANTFMGPYWVGSSSIGYLFVKTGTDNFSYYKTTNGGASWGSPTTVAEFTTDNAFGVSTYHDRDTPYDDTKIHICWCNLTQDEISYRSLDTSTDTLSSIVTVVSLTTGEADNHNCNHIVRARGGNLYIAYEFWNGTEILQGFYRSTDDGAAWTSRATVFEDSDKDCQSSVLLPANAADADDVWMVYGDISASELTVKTYDNSANSWSESSAASATIVFQDNARQVSASIRHSDGHAIIGLNTHVNNSAADLMVFEFDGSTITTKTNIITNTAQWATCAVCIDQNTDDIYVAWLGKPDGSESWAIAVHVYYAKSTDGGTSWSAATQYSEGSAKDTAAIWVPPSVLGVGRFYIVFNDGVAEDLLGNAVNSVVLTAGNTYNMTAALIAVSGASSMGPAQFLRTIALTQSATTTYSRTLTMLGQVLLTGTGSLTPSSQLTWTGVVALLTQSGVSVSGFLSWLATVVLTDVAGTNVQSGQAYTSPVTLSVVSASTTSNSLILQKLISLLVQAATPTSGQQVMSGTIHLQSGVVMTPLGPLTTTVLTELFGRAAMFPAGLITNVSSILLNQQTLMSVMSDRSLTGTVSLSTVQMFTAAHTAVITAILNLIQGADISDQVLITSTSTIELVQHPSVSPIATLSITEQTLLTLQAALTAVVPGQTYSETVDLAAFPNMLGLNFLTLAPTVGLTAIGTAADQPAVTATGIADVTGRAVLSPSNVSVLVWTVALQNQGALTPTAALVLSLANVLSAQPGISTSTITPGIPGTINLTISGEVTPILEHVVHALAVVAVNANILEQETLLAPMSVQMTVLSTLSVDKALSLGTAIALGVQHDVETITQHIMSGMTSLSVGAGDLEILHRQFTTVLTLSIASVFEARFLTSPIYLALMVAAETLRAAAAANEHLSSSGAVDESLEDLT